MARVEIPKTYLTMIPAPVTVTTIQADNVNDHVVSGTDADRCMILAINENAGGGSLLTLIGLYHDPEDRTGNRILSLAAATANAGWGVMGPFVENLGAINLVGANDAIYVDPSAATMKLACLVLPG